MTPRVLVYGYGNPGRLDDGLGPALAARLTRRAMGDGVRVETAYQLQIEDAALVAEHDVVVFVDAHAQCPPPFDLRPLVPKHDAEFTTHALAPEAVLALAHQCFPCRTRGYALGIRGYDFDDYGEMLTTEATHNLEAAESFLARALTDGSLVNDHPAIAPEGDLHA